MSDSSAWMPPAATASEPLPAPPQSPFGWSDDKLIPVLILCGLLPYTNILVNGFVYDDNTQVLNNPYIQNFHHLREIFSTNVWSYVGAQGVSNYYRPLMTFGYLICYQLFGPLAYGFHLASILIHAAVVVMVFKVTGRMFGNPELAFVAAADPYDSRVHFSLGRIYMDTGRNSDARREFQAGLLTDLKNSEALAALDKLRRQAANAKSPSQ